MRKILLLLPLLASSCSHYKSQFGCPIPKGVNCSSVTEIESQIVENPEGADFWRAKKKDGCGCSSEGAEILPTPATYITPIDVDFKEAFTKTNAEVIIQKKQKIGRLLLEKSTSRQGSQIDEHFIYFVLDEGGWIHSNKVQNIAHEQGE